MTKSVLDRYRLAQKRGDAEIILSKFDREISKALRRKEGIDIVCIKNRPLIQSEKESFWMENCGHLSAVLTKNVQLIKEKKRERKKCRKEKLELETRSPRCGWIKK